MPKSITLNINIPDITANNIQGVKICIQAKGKWTEDYILSQREAKKIFYKISGTFQHETTDVHSDSWALENNFISIVPVHLDCSVSKHNKFLKYLEYDF